MKFAKLFRFGGVLGCKAEPKRRFRPNVELLESRLALSTLDGNGPVVTGLSEPPGSASLVITFDGDLNLASTLTAQQLAFFQVNALAAGVNPELITTKGASVPVLSGTYAVTGTFSSSMTLTLGAALNTNQFYRVFIDGSPTVNFQTAVPDPSTAVFGASGGIPTVPFDGDNDDTSTGDFYGLFASGTNLQFTDSQGHSVSLSINNGATLNVWRELDGDIDGLSVANGSGATLSGSASGPVVIGSPTIPVAGAFSPGSAVNGLSSNFITPINFTGTTNGTNVITDVSNMLGLEVGEAIYGADVAIAGGPVAPGPPVIAAINGSSIILNLPTLPTTPGTISEIALSAYPAVIAVANVSGIVTLTDPSTAIVTINVASTAGLEPGQLLVDSTGQIIPADTPIATVDANTQSITINTFATLAPGTKVTLTAFTSYPAPPPSPAPVVGSQYNLPYTLSVQPISTPQTPQLPGIQSADFIQVAPTPAFPAGLWLFFGGRVNGMHNFKPGSSAFPTDSQNLDIFIINPANWQVLAQAPWSSTDVPFATYQALVSAAQQKYQSGNTFYATGGYSAPISAVFTANATAGSNVITVTSGDISGLAVGQSVSESDSQSVDPIPQGAAIIAISGNTITLNENATTTSAISLTAFGNTVVATFSGDTAKGSRTITHVSSFTGLAGSQTLTDSANAIPPGSIIDSVGPDQITFNQPIAATQQGAFQDQTGDVITASYTSFTTWDTLTSLSISGLTNALLHPTLDVQGRVEVVAAAQLQQISDPRLQVTGGEMSTIGGTTYLVIGQNFRGGYFGPVALQTYSSEIRSFVINNSPLGISNFQALRDPVNFRRRDYNLGATIQSDGQPGLSIFGGVFTEPGFAGYGNPVAIDASGAAQVNFDYSQYFSQYATTHVPLFDSGTGSMYTLFLGGIGEYAAQNGGLVGPQPALPWIANITSFVTSASGADQEFEMGQILPVTPTGTGFYGAESGFFAALGLPTYANGVIQLNKLNGPTVLGYMYGGIYSQLPETHVETSQTLDSNQVFEIVLTPNSPNQNYVNNLYQLLLNRAVDPSGSAYWVGQLNSGVSPAMVVLGIENSSEYQSDLVAGFYQHYLNRAADSSAQYWVDQLQSGASIEDVIDGIVSSPEFYNVEGKGTDAAFVDALYASILGRAPGATELNYWTAALAGGSSRAAVAMGFLTGTEYQQDLVAGVGWTSAQPTTNPPSSYFQGYYLTYLRQQGDPNGVAYWLLQLQAGVADQRVLAGILGSTEGFNKWS